MEWISVEDRLPERENPREMRAFCIVALDDGSVTDCCFGFDDSCHPGWVNLFLSGLHPNEAVITHWMPWTKDMIDNLPAHPSKMQ